MSAISADRHEVQHPAPTFWAPLARPRFLMLWLAGLLANTGIWMQSVSATWVMTELTVDVAMVALVQSATTFPMLVLALLAGALADVLDLRRVLLATQTWKLLTVVALAAVVLTQAVTPMTTLLLTCLFGVGVALSMPAWQVIVFELVPRDELTPGIALTGVSINLARAIGPLVAGLLIAWAGAGPALVANAGVLALAAGLVLSWRQRDLPQDGPPEGMFEAMRAGLRFVSHEPTLQRVLLRIATFVFFGSALWALLPVVARRTMGLDALGYGALLGCLGVGAIGAAAALSKLRERFSLEAIVRVATVAFGLATLPLAFAPVLVAVAPTLVVSGGAWLILMTCYSVVGYGRLPGWVRARAAAVLVLAFFGGMTIGGVVWGILAQIAGTPLALALAGAGSLFGLIGAAHLRLPDGPPPDVSPGSHHWPVPVLRQRPDDAEGPVLVTVEYLVRPEQAAEFRRAMRAVRRERLRTGAFRWDLFVDPEDPSRHLETMLTATWAEHLRAHARGTEHDWVHEECARRFHTGSEPPAVRHFVAERLPRRSA